LLIPLKIRIAVKKLFICPKTVLNILRVFVFMGISTPLFSQGVSLFGYSTYQLMNPKGFNNFVSSYNAYNTNFLKTPMNKPTPVVGWGLGVAMLVSIGQYPLEYAMTESVSKATFNDGSVRTMRLRSQHLSGGMGVFLGNFKRAYCLPEFGVSVGTNRIVSSFTSTSTGTITDFFSGNYKTSLIGSAVYAGFTAAVGGSVKLLMRARYYFALSPTTLEDDSKGFSYQQLPQNTAAYVAGPRFYTGEYVKDEFGGLRLSLGLTFDFGKQYMSD
jgi:hypothetical protein